MQIKHAFVSVKAEQADASLVGPNEWNAALVATVAANNVVIGNNAGTNQPAAELTASQILDMVSSTNGVLLTRTAGAWGAITNVTTDNGDVVITNNTTPVVPAAGSKISSQSVGGRSMFGVQPSSGALYTVQPHVGRKRVREVRARAQGTVPDGLGMAASNAAGSFTARTPAVTNMFTAAHRMGVVSGAGAGNQAEIGDNTVSGQAWLGNAAGLGGFHFVERFGVSDAVIVSTANMFVGLVNPVYASDTQPQTLTNLIGVGCTSGDTVLQAYGAGAAAQARVSLGVNFPCNTVNTDWYELVMWAPPNATTVFWQVTRLNTGNVASGSWTGAQLPANTVLLTWQTIRSNGGTAAAVGVDLSGVYIETET